MYRGQKVRKGRTKGVLYIAVGKTRKRKRYLKSHEKRQIVYKKPKKVVEPKEVAVPIRRRRKKTLHDRVRVVGNLK